jgi:hypothetical protein
MATTPPTNTTNDKSKYHRIMATTPPTNTTNDKSNYLDLSFVVIVGGVVAMILW